jgi:phage terminase large subunit-like protein
METELLQRRNENKLTRYTPYSKQAEFHAAGDAFRERLLMAGNQLGKTWSASYELAMHLTGRYPDWWQGAEWDSGIVSWASGVTSEATRDTVQRLLMGRPGNHGTGAIPKSAIKSVSSKRGVADAIDTVIIRHGGGGDIQASESSLGFKSYDQGREKFQGETLEIVWFDEEPPMDIYTEGLTRTNATNGIVLLTFTPLKGMSEVVKRYLVDKMPGTHVTSMTIYDVDHYTPEQRQAIINSYPAHERDARTKGIPTLGSGKVFPVVEEDITVAPFSIPNHWPRIGGIDFGWDHPSAAVELVWDKDSDIVYITREFRAREQTPVLLAAAVKPWGKWLPWAWPHDGLQHDKGSGEQLAKQYKDAGLKMLGERATFEDGSNGLEAGIMEMLDRMQTGRWKVFSTCQLWLEEFRMFHRKDGLIVKEADDVISASRYAYMMRRKAVTPEPPKKDPVSMFTPLDPDMGY